MTLLAVDIHAAINMRIGLCASAGGGGDIAFHFRYTPAFFSFCFVFPVTAPGINCLQEKEFEVTNEYIFALGSHVIYWSSKDVSLFVAQQVVADAIAAEDAAGGTAAAAAAAGATAGAATPARRRKTQEQEWGTAEPAGAEGAI